MKTVRVVAAVIRNGSLIYATQRGYGGKIEDGETPEQALKREIQEELDTVISVGALIDTIEYDYPSFHLSMQCYFAEVVSGKLTLVEAEDARWLSYDMLDSVNWLPADLELVSELKQQIAEIVH
jgi:8-oxo-dGTP diphosphatase